MQESTTLQPPVFVDLNVLPEELRPRRYPAWYVLGIVAILAASFLLIPLYQAERAGDAETARLRSELELINEELGRVQVDFGQARELRQQIETTEAAIAALNEERQAILGGGQELSTDLSAITEALPPGGRLASVTSSEGQLSLQGRADRATDVLEYSRALTRSGRFSEARITSLAIEGGEEEGAGMTFTIELAR
jgi:Tfp pilus assembly protein PilN